MARDGYPFVAVPLGLALVAGLLEWFWIALPLLGLAGFVAFFFRDPTRTIPADKNLLVSPADGKVVRIQNIPLAGLGEYQRLSIFLSVFNVHINRLPCDGEITDIRYQPGKFMAAFNHKASDENEQNTVSIRHDEKTYRVTQIAGLIARRIVCWKATGDSAARGARFGLIRFGSRVDLDLPPDVEILVAVGDRVRGGTTVVGRLRR